jgi:hypothetical protein
MKFHYKYYYHPTPAKMRKLGDALLGVSQFATGYAVINDSKELAIAFMVIGLLGKFLTNFYTENKNDYHDKEYT